MKYESTILKRLIDTYGVVGNPHYISEIIKEFIVRGKERFPELFTYQADWLAHIDEFGLNPTYTVSYTGQSIYAPNTLERPVKSAILTGSTKYRDIDTGEVLDGFEEGRNLELVSVRMPVLTTSNEDGTKTNVLSCNEEVTLRGIGEVKDTLDCLTGEVTERIGEIVLDGSQTLEPHSFTGGSALAIKITDPSISFKQNSDRQESWDFSDMICDKELIAETKKWDADEWNNGYNIALISSSPSNTYSINSFVLAIRKSYFNVQSIAEFKNWLTQNPLTIQYKLAKESVKTVDLTILDQNGQNVKQLMSFKGGTHFNTRNSEGSPLPLVSVSVETDLEETLKVCSLDGNTL